MNYFLNNFQAICQFILKNFYNCNWWVKYDQLQQVEFFSKTFMFLQIKIPEDIFDSNLTMLYCLGVGKIDTWWIGAFVIFFPNSISSNFLGKSDYLVCYSFHEWILLWHVRWVTTKLSIISFDHFVIPRRILCNRNKMQNRIWLIK